MNDNDNNTKRIARQIFFTGRTDIEPTEDEEYDLKTRYGLDLPKPGKFNDEVEEVVSYYEDEEVGPTLDDKFPPHTKHVLARIADEIEDEFRLDLDNDDPKKYIRLNNKLEAFKKFVWRRIMLSKLPDFVKEDLDRIIDRAETAEAILMTLYGRISI